MNRHPTSGLINKCALTFGLLSASCTWASSIPLVNGDFSDPANDGSVGGGIAGGSGDALIGGGPWHGRYEAIAASLLPPTLSIGNGRATVSQIAVNALGIANGGMFYQLTNTAIEPAQHYVLAADVGASDVLTLDLLASGNAGLGLAAGTASLSSTSTSNTIGFTSTRHGRFHVALGYDSSAADSGNLVPSLYALPTGVLALQLLSDVTFDNVVMTAADMAPLPPATLGSAAGTPQAASVNTNFSAPLAVSVVDAQGNPLAGVTVTFSAPASGASAAFTPASAVTDVGGRAQTTAHANGTSGVYDVTAGVSGVDAPTTFRLTNTGSGQPTVTEIAGGGSQAQTVTLGFECRLAVQVFNGSEPAQGATVVFASPSSGASALLTDSLSSGTQLSETTDSNGMASVVATADVTPGAYAVTATLTAMPPASIFTPIQIAAYPMTNLAVGDRIGASGFEDEPASCGGFIK